jgi:hypothetical protein
MKTSYSLAIAAALGMLAMMPAGAQTLTHRYSFTNGAADSVGTANGTVNGGVTFAGGVASFPGGTSAAPVDITLPTTVVSGLTNATLEFYTTSFTGTTNYEALFAEANSYGTGGGAEPDYTVLCANRAFDPGIGSGARTNGGTEDHNIYTGTNLGSGVNLVTVVYSGFVDATSNGTETIYVNGVQATTGATPYSFLNVANATNAASLPLTVGIGGGSPYNDPNYQGGMSDVRIWSGAFTPAQVLADYNAGPDVLGVAAPEPSQLIGLAMGALSVGSLALKARRRLAA